MAYRKKTLRTMSPTARKVARLAGELDSVATRLKNMIPDLQRLDLDSKALAATMNTAKRFCSRYSSQEAIENCQHDPMANHEFIPTGTSDRCLYGSCKGSQCQICDKFEVVG